MIEKDLRNNEADRLVQEGAQSYPDALLALAAFRQEIYNRCTHVVMAHRDPLQSAIGASFNREHIQQIEWNLNTEAGLYVKLQSPAMIKMVFYSGIDWWYDEDWKLCIAVDAGFWVPLKRQDKLKTAVKGICERQKMILWHDDGVYIGTRIDPAEAHCIQEKLAEVIKIWVEAGEKCRGFLAHLAETLDG